jgi:hypothetical protein
MKTLKTFDLFFCPFAQYDIHLALARFRGPVSPGAGVLGVPFV